jgi:hypothetical protein
MTLNRSLLLKLRPNTFFHMSVMARLCKHLVFESPSRINLALDRWYHLSSSSRKSLAISAFDWLLRSIFDAVRGRTSAKASRSSLIDESRSFSF